MSTIVGTRTTLKEVLELGEEYPSDPEEPPRPKTWGDCLAVKRGTKENPCPYAGCGYHLALDVTLGGSLSTLFPDRDADEVPWTCSLAFAAANPDGATLEEIGKIIGCTRERIRQIESRALRRLQKAGPER